MSPHQNKLSILRTGHVLDVIRIGAIATTGLWFRLLVTWGLLGIFLQEVAFAENPPPIAMRVFNNEIRKHGDVERARRVAFDYWVVEAAEGRWPPGPALNQEIRRWKGPNANQFDLRTGVLVGPDDDEADQPIPQPQAIPQRLTPKQNPAPRGAAKKTFGQLPLDEKKMLADAFRGFAQPVARTPDEKATAADSFLRHVITHPEADWAKASLDHLTSVILAAKEQNAVAAINNTPIDYLVFYKELLEETRGGEIEYPPGSGTSVSEGLARRLSAACGEDKPRTRSPDSLSDKQAEWLGRHQNGTLSLNGLRTLTDTQAELLALHSGNLWLDGLASLSDKQAESLGRHKANLWLDGLAAINDAQAQALALHRGSVSLSGITVLTAAQAKALSRHKGDLRLRGVSALSDEAAQAISQHSGWLMLDGLTTLSAKAAVALQANDDVWLPDWLE